MAPTPTRRPSSTGAGVCHQAKTSAVFRGPESPKPCTGACRACEAPIWSSNGVAAVALSRSALCDTLARASTPVHSLFLNRLPPWQAKGERRLCLGPGTCCGATQPIIAPQNTGQTRGLAPEKRPFRAESIGLHLPAVIKPCPGCSGLPLLSTMSTWQ